MRSSRAALGEAATCVSTHARASADFVHSPATCLVAHVQAGDGFGERQRGAFGIAKIGRVAPCGHGEETLVRFARLLKEAPFPLEF